MAGSNLLRQERASCSVRAKLAGSTTPMQGKDKAAMAACYNQMSRENKGFTEINSGVQRQTGAHPTTAGQGPSGTPLSDEEGSASQALRWTLKSVEM